MSIIELFWYLNVTDATRYLIIIGVIIFILALCIINGKKKKSNHKKKQTKCQVNYKKCIRDNKKNKTNNFCYPCLNNGNSPDFFYNQEIGQWVKLT